MLIVLKQAFFSVLTACMVSFHIKINDLALTCPKCGESHLDREALARVAHYKYVCTCCHTWVTKKRAVSNPLVVFNLCLVEPKLRFSNDRGAYLCKMYKCA